mmetsp:Transcript_2452/g.2577  ORF Transcript_2452/g.2577 Transcript_2452/m.2577 type:complete len:201 (-) Transcript_2452:253-855(-)
MVDVQYSSPQSLGKRDGFFNKRRRQDENCYDTENAHPQFPSFDRGQPEKRARRSFGNNPEDADIDTAIYSQRDMIRFQQEFDANVSNMRAEFRKTLQETNIDSENTRNNLVVAMRSIDEGRQQIEKVEEENRLFKRAIAIQEGRYREVAQQSQQLREALTQAVEHIGQIEKINSNLKEQLRRGNGPEFISHSHFLPPDVY